MLRSLTTTSLIPSLKYVKTLADCLGPLQERTHTELAADWIYFTQHDAGPIQTLVPALMRWFKLRELKSFAGVYREVKFSNV